MTTTTRPINNFTSSKAPTDTVLSFIDSEGKQFTMPASIFDDLEVGRYKVITDLIEEGDKKYTRTRQFTRATDGTIIFVN